MTNVNLVQVVQNREGLSPDEDVAVITMHCRGAVGGLPDDPADMTTGRRDEFVSRLQGFLDALIHLFPTEITWEKAIFYDVPPDGSNAGPRVDEYPLGTAGTGVGGCLPPQIASTVSLRTAKRKNWGRFYLPSLVNSSITHNGRLNSTAIGEIATAAADLAQRGTTVLCPLTVWSPTEKTHHDVQAVACDDIYDIIRSRRFSMALDRQVRPVST